MSTYFSMIFEVHHMVLRYNVCLEEYMNLLPRSISDTTSENTNPMKGQRGMRIKKIT